MDTRGSLKCIYIGSFACLFGVDHIKKLKIKYKKVLLYYYFGSEKLKGIPNRVELLEAVMYF